MSTIAVSVWGGTARRTVDDVVEGVRAARDAGYDGLWFPQTTTVDTLTALALAAHLIPGIPIGTAVVPIQGRHPIPLAQQALTVAAAAGAGRLTLGLGVSHPAVSEGWYGVDYGEVVGWCREQLEALGGLLSPERRADVVGSHLTARATLSIDGPSPGLVLGALGPRMLDLAGHRADGTVTWMTGPRSLRHSIVPTIRAAAEQAGRPEPRVIAGLPVCVTDDVAGARDRIRPRIEGASHYPSYRRMLDAEDLTDLADLAIVGSQEAVEERISELGGIGVTELVADVFGTAAECEATASVLGGIS